MLIIILWGRQEIRPNYLPGAGNAAQLFSRRRPFFSDTSALYIAPFTKLCRAMRNPHSGKMRRRLHITVHTAGSGIDVAAPASVSGTQWSGSLPAFPKFPPCSARRQSTFAASAADAASALAPAPGGGYGGVSQVARNYLRPAPAAMWKNPREFRCSVIYMVYLTLRAILPS